MCLLANVLIEGSFLPLFYLLIALCHEAGHLCAFYFFSRKISSIQFVGFGIKIQKGSHLTYVEEMIVALVGPMVNIIFGIIFLFIHTTFHSVIYLSFAAANFAYAVLNLLPLSPLDGYKILKDIILYKIEYNQAKKLLFSVHIFSIIIIFLIVITMIALRIMNFSLISVMIVLLINALSSLVRQEMM